MEISVLFFIIVAHMLWDISEDVFIYRVSFRRWERTWGLNKKDLEEAYKNLLELKPVIVPPLEKKISRLRKAATSIRERMRRKLKVPVA